MIIKTYKLYLIKNFLKNLGQITLIFFSLTFILNLFEEINFLKDEDVSFFFPMFLTFLNTPSILFEMFPFIFLITTMFFFINLFEKDELNIFKNFGLTNFNILKVISTVSLLVGILIIFLFYNFSAKLKFFYLDLKNEYAKDNKYLAVVTENGLWIKDEIDKKINIINADNIEGNFLKNVSISQFTNNFNLIQNLISEKIDIKNNNWILYNVSIFKENALDKKSDKMTLSTNFNINKINNLFSNLSSLTFWELNELKKDYQKLGYSYLEINTHKQKIYSYPLYLTLMCVLSSILMFNIGYNKPKVFNLIAGVLLSVIIYYVNFFFNFLGDSQKIPLIISIWLPLLILFLISAIGIVTINEK